MPSKTPTKNFQKMHNIKHLSSAWGQ